MRILSFQSQVIFGHVGNSAAAFPLQCLGHDVWAVPTAILSNHAGYPDTAGRAAAPAEIAALVAGLDRRGALAACDLLLSGYLGAPATAAIVADAVARVRAANPDALYCCDPVLGDRGPGIYVDPDLPGRFAAALVPLADLLTPNLFELEVLAGMSPGALDGADLSDIVTGAREVLTRMRPGGCLLVTSVEHRDQGDGMAAMLAVDDGGAWLVETPLFAFAIAPHGAGDLVAALFAACFAAGRQPSDALAESAAVLHAVFVQTARTGAAELALVDARNSFTMPSTRFAVRDIG